MIIFLVSLFFVVRTLDNLCLHLFWWQMKEYRFDRMLVHLRETNQGQSWLFGKLAILKWILLLLFWPLTVVGLAGIFPVLVFGTYAGEFILDWRSLKRGNWRVPEWRLKSGLLFLFMIVVQFLLLFWPIAATNFYLRLLVADKLLGPVLALGVFLLNRVFSLHKEILFRKAALKFAALPINSPLTVVGVTGSYGKSTTKEFIAQLLALKYRVLKTPASKNTDIGIAELILQRDLSRYDFFVVEVAAYKEGEIAKSISLVKSRLKCAVITGINEQHQSLFGSLTTTINAKLELAKALPLGGLAILNSRDEYYKTLAARLKTLNVAYKPEAVFSEYQKIEREKGVAFAQNLALAVQVAREFQVPEAALKSAFAGLKTVEKTMSLVTRNGLTLINDTFNANPKSVSAALAFLKGFSGKKIMVLQPLIELGRYAPAIHERLGYEAALICDEIILTNYDFHPFFQKGVLKSRRKVKLTVATPLPLLPQGAILFEGKGAEKYFPKQ